MELTGWGHAWPLLGRHYNHSHHSASKLLIVLLEKQARQTEQWPPDRVAAFRTASHRATLGLSCTAPGGRNASGMRRSLIYGDSCLKHARKGPDYRRPGNPGGWPDPGNGAALPDGRPPCGPCPSAAGSQPETGRAVLLSSSPVAPLAPHSTLWSSGPQMQPSGYSTKDLSQLGPEQPRPHSACTRGPAGRQPS